MRIRKIISIILCAVIACLSAVLGVNAAEDPTFILDEKINADKTVTLSISCTPDVAAAGTIKLAYNEDRLRFVDASKGTMDATNITVNPKSADNLICANFLKVDGPVTGDTNLIVVNFEITSGEFSQDDVVVANFKLYDIDSKLLTNDSTTDPVYKLDSKSSPSDIKVTDSNGLNLRDKARQLVSTASVVTASGSENNDNNSQSNVSGSTGNNGSKSSNGIIGGSKSSNGSNNSSKTSSASASDPESKMNLTVIIFIIAVVVAGVVLALVLITRRKH